MSQISSTAGSALSTIEAPSLPARGVVTEAQMARAIARGRRLQSEAVREIFGEAFRRVLHPFAAPQGRREGPYGDRTQAC